MEFIPVARPALVGNEREYVLDCLDSNWISSTGKYISAFEDCFADFCGAKHAMACCNGTVALHLALLGLGIGAGDEVILPTLTYVATANSVLYTGARPILSDCESDTWNIDPNHLESLITPKTRAIMVVHLYGHPADMDPILDIAHRHSLFVIEDAAEAHGAEYKGRKAGSIGHVATFSFYGNKVITTGEGGMVTTNDDLLAARIRQLRGQGQDPVRRYWFPILGYNYRMTNVTAAIGLAQLERIEWQIERRRQVAQWYQTRLGGIDGVQTPVERPSCRNIYWLYSIVLTGRLTPFRDEVMIHLRERGIETRPFFYPMHRMPVYEHLDPASAFPVAERLAAGGINLPTWAELPADQVTRVCDELMDCLRLIE